MVSLIKNEFLERLKNELSEVYYNSYLESLNKNDNHGMTVNFDKLSKSSIDIDYLKNKFDLQEIFKNKDYGYYIYDKEKLGTRSIFPGKDPLYHAGLYYIQEPSAAKVLFDVPFNSDDIVLDLCASPGGKSAQILYSLNKNDGGFLVSNEVDSGRTQILNSNIERLGFENIAITSSSTKSLLYNFENYFDKVLVDAPCSGEGMFRKSADARLNWSESLVKSCSKIQNEIIDYAYCMLKKGGILIYSTCTFSKNEDEDVVNNLVKKYSDLSIVKSEKIYPFNTIGEGQFYTILKKAGDNNDKNKKPTINSFNNLKLIRYGINNYQKVGNHIMPSHASTHVDDIEFENVVELNDIEIYKYLKGEVIKKELDFEGYCKITYKNLGIGLAKSVKGILKNHYPKGLRLF